MDSGTQRKLLCPPLNAGTAPSPSQGFRTPRPAPRLVPFLVPAPHQVLSLSHGPPRPPWSTPAPPGAWTALPPEPPVRRLAGSPPPRLPWPRAAPPWLLALGPQSRTSSPRVRERWGSRDRFAVIPAVSLGHRKRKNEKGGIHHINSAFPQFESRLSDHIQFLICFFFN